MQDTLKADDASVGGTSYGGGFSSSNYIGNGSGTFGSTNINTQAGTGSPGYTFTTTGSTSSIAPVKPIEKSKVRYILIKKDGTTRELQEQNQITPREMIGISKLMATISTYVSVVLGAGAGMYNININWSKLITDLSIDKHFVDGLPVASYNQDDDVLDIFLYDPQ